ncbi:MAG: hypothetical protein ABIR08_06950, partial [Sphingomonas sp.]
SCLLLPQDRDHLLLGKPAALHLRPPRVKDSSSNWQSFRGARQASNMAAKVEGRWLPASAGDSMETDIEGFSYSLALVSDGDVFGVRQDAQADQSKRLLADGPISANHCWASIP